MPVMSNLTRIASGLRNAASLAIDPANGDLDLADNGIDGNDGGNEAWSADELDIIPAAMIGKQVEDFGFPDGYVKTIDVRRESCDGGGSDIRYSTDDRVRAPSRRDAAAGGSESEGASVFALSPPDFPAGLNHGVFIGFHGLFAEGGTTNDENPMLFADPITGHYFDFISNDLPNIGHLDEAMLTADSLFVADISSTGDVFGSSGPGQGVIYQIKALPATNVEPVIAPIGDQTVDEGHTLTVQVQATDPNPGQSLT